MASRAGIMLAVALVFALVFGAAWLFTTATQALARPEQLPWLVEYSPLPHHVPQFAGGAAFRFAMVHDVVHERFAKHGPMHYQERNRLTREKLAALEPDEGTTHGMKAARRWKA